jgi:hypothetical protein
MEAAQDRILLTVIDSDCGIADADKPCMFSKFFRADNTRKTFGEGTEVGLYIAKSIIERSGRIILNHCALKRTDSVGVLLKAGGLRPRYLEFVFIVFMVGNIVLNHLCRDIARADGEESSGPQMLTPISFP